MDNENLEQKDNEDRKAFYIALPIIALFGGLLYYFLFNSKEPDPAVMAGNSAFIDTDADGIADNIDRCANEKGTLENQGCLLPLDSIDTKQSGSDESAVNQSTAENQVANSTEIASEQSAATTEEEVETQKLTESAELLSEAESTSGSDTESEGLQANSEADTAIDTGAENAKSALESKTVEVSAAAQAEAEDVKAALESNAADAEATVKAEAANVNADVESAAADANAAIETKADKLSTAAETEASDMKSAVTAEAAEVTDTTLAKASDVSAAAADKVTGSGAMSDVDAKAAADAMIAEAKAEADSKATEALATTKTAKDTDTQATEMAEASKTTEAAQTEKAADENPDDEKSNIIDTDGDGVIDADDACPTQIGSRTRQGCPTDIDDDGIADNEDKCPDIAGSEQNAGCPESTVDAETDAEVPANDNTEQSVTESEERLIQDAGFSIQFKAGNSELTERSREILLEVSKVMKRYPDIQLEAHGFSDSKGAADVNKSLSQKRAQSCINVLAEAGIDSGRLKAIGFGEAQPIATNETAVGRQKNRRVEFKLVR